MAASAKFQEVLRSVVSGLTQGEIVERTGISQAYVNNMLTQGRVPRQEKLMQLCDGLNFGPRDRCRLFEAAGYEREARIFDDQMEKMPWPRPVAETADVLCRLNDDQLAAVRRIAEMMVDRRVMHALLTA